MNPLRILFVSWRDLDHPLAGGSEVLVDRLATGLGGRGHDVTLLASGATRPTGPYQVVDAGGRLAQYLSNPLTARRLGRFDVVVDVCNGVPFFAPLWANAPTVTLINHIHFGMWREWFSPSVSLIGSTIETKAMPLVYRRRQLVAVSDSTAKALVSLGIPSERISVVHNGVDLREPGSPRAPRSVEPTFLAVGRLVPHKRFDLLLRAWAKVQPMTGGRLLIAGDGPQRAELEAQLPPSAELLGRVSEEEKRALMESAWFLVQPSRLEGWGLVVMEAAAAGTPTLGFWAPGTRDAVVHGESGVLVRTEAELIDEWIRLVEDDETRRVLSKGAAERAQRFSWERSITEFEAVLEAAALGIEPTAPPAPALPAGQDRRARAASLIRTKGELLRLFMAEKHTPGPFYRRLAEEWVSSLPYQVEGKRLLDLGAGSGEMTDALRRAGATVVAVDLAIDPNLDAEGAKGFARADGGCLPFASETFDGVVCSNMLEHTPDPSSIVHEIARVVVPGGWAWVSWTNWYSPWGGHEIVPFHYLGPRVGHRVWRSLFGEVRKNAPFEELWPTYISQILTIVNDHPALEVRGVHPRYYPSQRWIVRVPGVREVLTWNCVIQLERRTGVQLESEPPLVFGAHGPMATGRRTLRRVRRSLGDHPAFLPLVLRATPLGTSRRITDQTELVIEGFPRSGNTFAHFAILHAEPGAVITSRVHSPSQVKLAVRRGVPTLLTIRNPIDTVASAAVAARHVPIPSLLQEYIHQYVQVYPLLDQVMVATFDELVTDFDEVLTALNERFGLGFRPFGHSEANVDAVFAEIASHHVEHWGSDNSSLPVPAEGRRHLNERARAEIARPEYASLLQEAQTVFETVAAHSVTAADRRPPAAPRSADAETLDV